MDINILFIVQKIGAPFLPLMNFVSLLGYGELYIILVAVLYWTISTRSAIKLGLTVFVGTQINIATKLTLKSPRPSWLNKNVLPQGHESSFGMPSGHAQGSMLFWGQFAYIAKKNWLFIVSAIIVFLTGVSRIVLGVHFPSQVVVGWLLGFLTIVVINYYEESFLKWFLKKNIASQLILIFVLSSISLIYIGIFSYIKGPWVIPETWINSTVDLRKSFIELIQVSGMLFGLLSGAILLKKVVVFNTDGTILKKVIRLLGGLVLIFSIWYGLKFDSYILQYLRSVLFAFSISFIWPWICIKLKLA